MSTARQIMYARRLLRHLPLVAALLCTVQEAAAACSRALVVPASSLGQTMVVDPSRGEVSGILPDLLRESGERVGCEFIFPIVPRSRAEMMTRLSDADMLVGAVKIPERDAWGTFIPMQDVDWTLISTRNGPKPRTIDDLLIEPGVKFSAVRGFNYGRVYLDMLSRLASQGKLEYVNDPDSIVRKMKAGRANYTFMPSTTFAGAVDRSGLRGMLGGELSYTRLADMPSGQTGIYLSKRMSPADVEQITAMLAPIRKNRDLLHRFEARFTGQELASFSRRSFNKAPAGLPGTR